MKNFKNSKTAKVVSGFVGLAMTTMMLPGVASADTIADLTAQINALLAQVAALQAASGSGTMTMTGGHDYAVDLTVGSKGDDVTALQQMLVAKGFLVMPAGVDYGYFGGLTKAAVAKWQAANNITPSVGYFGPKSRAAANAMGGSMTTTGGTTTLPAGCTSTSGFSPTTGASCATGVVVVAGSGLNVMLDSMSNSNTLISPQGVATLAVFKFTNGASVPAKVTMLKFKRTGISSDTTLNNVYLYDSMGNRLTDAASVATGMINFSDSAGLVMVPALGSVSVAVRGDVASGQNGQTIGVMLTDATTDAGSVSGLPVSGGEHTISTAPSGMSTIDFTGTTVPVTGSIDAQNDYTVWQRTVSVGSRDAMMSAVRFQQIGSAYSDDVVNFRLMVDGTTVGSAVAKQDANRFVSFNFATPVTLKAGSHVLKLVADVVGGANRNFQFSLRRVVDVEIWDSQLNVVVTPTVGNSAFTAIDAGIMSVNAGTLTVTKSTDSPSGNVVNNGSAVTLAKFNVRAAGEKIKVENLRFGWTGTSSGAKIRNGALFLNGVQIGSTADLVTTASNGTTFNLGSSMVLDPGVDYALEVRGDVFNNGTGGAFVANDNITVSLLTPTSANLYRMSSLGYISNAGATGNQLTVAAGSLALSKYTAYANQTITTPQTAYKIGEFRLTGGNTEGVNLDTFTLTIAGSLGATTTDMANMYIVYGSKTSQVKSSGGSQTWSVNDQIAANATMNIAVYATLNSSITAPMFLTPTLTVSGTSQTSGSAVSSSAVTGQTITVGSGSINSAVDASTPVSTLVVANTMPKIASFKFTAQNDAFTIDEVTAKLNSTAGAAAIKNLVWKDGATTISTQPIALDASGIYAATSTGLSVAVGYNGTKVLDVYADLGDVGTGFAGSGANVGVTLDTFEYLNSNGVKTRDGTDRVANNFYVYKTKPTITNVALPTTVLTAGTQTVYKFTVTADAGGTVAWQYLNFKVATTTGVTVSNFKLYEDSNQSTTLAGLPATLVFDPSTGVVTASSTIDQEVSGSKTYVLKADIGGTVTTGSSISTSIASGGATHAAPTDAASVVTAGSTNFVWSDESVVPHTSTSADWNNDNLVKNLPTDSLTLTK